MAVVSEHPQALVEHMRATLSMDWRSPPSQILHDLDRLQGQPWRATDPHHGWYGADRALEGARHPGVLAWMRAQADGCVAPDWALLCQGQRLILGEGAELGFRQGPAFAHQGRHRYGWFDGLDEIFKRKLAQDAFDPVHSLLKAVRLYLDLIYFHPFMDGNARAARLWFEYWLWRGRIMAPSWDVLARLEKVPGRVERYWAFASLCAQLSLKMSAEESCE